MVVGNQIVSDGPGNKTREKPVATALLLRDKRGVTFVDAARWNLQQRRLPADGTSSTPLNIALFDSAGRPVKDGIEVNLFAEGIVVEPAQAKTENGRVRVEVKSIKQPGRARLILRSGPFAESESFRLTAGKAARIHTEISEGRESEFDSKFQAVELKIQIVDQWGNGVSREQFSISIDGTENVEFQTDKRGVTSLEIDVSKRGGNFTLYLSNGSPFPGTIPAL